MAGADRIGRHDIEQWKKALLSRDFDLVHTQLLALDGDVTPTERLQLVQEIFKAVQQIEELTIGERYPQSGELFPEKEPQTLQPENERPSTSRFSMKYAVSEETIRSRHVTNKPRRLTQRNNFKYKLQCPVCDVTRKVGSGTRNGRGVRDDWFCNSCRLFKLRLARKHAEGGILPSCDHEGIEIKNCKGCRRYRLEKFWLSQRGEAQTFEIPLMGDDTKSSSEGASRSGENYDYESG